LPGKKDLGKFGEKIAEKLIKKKGFKLLEKNYRFLRCEIDLIFLDKKNNMIIFVEVKTRRNKKFGEPEESITHFKQRNMMKAAQGFVLNNKKYENYSLRFDTVSVLFSDNNEYSVNHIEEAF